MLCILFLTRKRRNNIIIVPGVSTDQSSRNRLSFFPVSSLKFPPISNKPHTVITFCTPFRVGQFASTITDAGNTNRNAFSLVKERRGINAHKNAMSKIAVTGTFNSETGLRIYKAVIIAVVPRIVNW